MNQGFLKHLGANIHRYGLLPDAKPVIVAVSGGADSVALLVALNRLGYECVAAHCNYHLRGEESNRDMRCVQALCSRLGIDLYVRDMDVEQRRRATGESVEMACRALRYDWFSDLLDRQRAQAIAVAHHREDNVETFFLNLVRGSGITGLGAMRWRNGYVVRPLLDFTRAEIEDFLESEDCAFVIDSTNAQNDFARNRWRNVILPQIEEAFPGSIDGIVASIGYMAENREFFDEAISLLREKYVTDMSNGGFEIDLEALKGEQRHSRQILHQFLRAYDYNFTQIDNILDCVERSGGHFESHDTRIEVDHGCLHLVPKDIAAEKEAASSGHKVSLSRDILAPAHILISEHSVSEFKPERDPNVAYFDITVTEGNPSFVLRHWQKGDRMTPYGMEGSKLVSDIYANAKYSASQKRKSWLLTRDGAILWAVGLRASDLFSISPSTRRYLRLQYRP